MKRDAITLATPAAAVPDTLAQFYCRLHEKSANPGGLFDPSWEVEPVTALVRHSWSAEVLRFSQGKNNRSPFFSHFIERLILLAPIELQKLLCAAVLLSKGGCFCRCIDGTKIRALDAVIGSTGLAAVRGMRTHQPAQASMKGPDWSVGALLGEAYAHIDLVYRGQRQLVLDYLRIALPRELPHMRSDCDAETFEKMVRQAHEWYPEFKWLFG